MLVKKRAALGEVSPNRFNRRGDGASHRGAKKLLVKPPPSKKDPIIVERLQHIWRKRNEIEQLTFAVSKWRSATLFSALEEIKVNAMVAAETTRKSPASARKRRRVWTTYEDTRRNEKGVPEKGAQRILAWFRKAALRKSFLALKLALAMCDESTMLDCDQLLSTNVDHPAVSAYVRELRCSASADEAVSSAALSATFAADKTAQELKTLVAKLNIRSEASKSKNSDRAEKLETWKSKYKN